MYTYIPIYIYIYIYIYININIIYIYIYILQNHTDMIKPHYKYVTIYFSREISESPWSCSPTSAYIDECGSSATPAAGEQQLVPARRFIAPKKEVAIDVCYLGVTYTNCFNTQIIKCPCSFFQCNIKQRMSETLASYMSAYSIFTLCVEEKQVGVNPNHRANTIRHVPCAELGYTVYTKQNPIYRDDTGQCDDNP